jgi:dynein intermediate chain
LDIHQQGDQIYSSDVGNLMLSSSVDWTVMLWNTKTGQKPLATFEAWEDYVYDVKWSPLYPSLFAAVDGDGNLDLWDLNRSMESPDVRSKVSQVSLNKVAFSPLGARIATGGLDGAVEVFTHDKERERELTVRFN